MSYIFPAFYPLLPPVSSAPEDFFHPKNLMENFALATLFFGEKETGNFFCKAHTNLIPIVYSYLPTSPIDSVERIQKIGELFQRIIKKNPGNCGVFKIEHGGIVFCPRFEAYLKLDFQISIYKYLEETWALKQAGKPEEKQASFSLNQIDRLTIKDFYKMDREHTRSLRISYKINIYAFYGKELAIHEKTLLFPLQIIGKYLKDPNIESISLRQSNIVYYPSITREFSQLKHLDLKGSQLHKLPLKILQLTDLKSLNLRQNRLRSLPTQITQTSLRHLDLQGNQLVSLPKEIGKLINLVTLCVNKNELSSLPKEIGNLIKLYLLDLSENKLTFLNKGIRNLKNLSYLYLNQNRLRFLLLEIGHLTNLKGLHLSKSDKKLLPEFIHKFLVSKNVDIIFKEEKKIYNLKNFLDLPIRFS